MKADTPLIILTTFFILLFGVLSSHLAGSTQPVETFAGSWACTADIRVCPDGSTVGRTPPYCQFALCH